MEEKAKEALDKLYVDTNKPLTAFLAICKAFDLNHRNILERIAKLPRQYSEIDHVRELCELPLIPLLPVLQPILDHNLKFRLNGVGSSQGNELRLSSDGEILEVMKFPFANNLFDYIKMDEMLDKITEFEKYLY